MNEQNAEKYKKIIKAAEALPSSVLGMHSLSPDDSAKLEDRYWGLIYKRRGMPAIRKFPLIDAGNTYMSALAFWLSKDSLPDGAKRLAAYFISHAAAKYGLEIYPFSSQIKSLAEEISGVPHTNVFKDDVAHGNTMTKSASDSTYYLVPDKKAYPVDTPKEVKVASSYFDDWHERMDTSVRRTYAKNLYKKAMELGVEVGDRIKKYAGEDRNPSFGLKLQKRAEFTEDPMHKKVWGKIEKMAEVMDNDTMIEVIARMDKVANLGKYYGSQFPDPVLTVVTDSKPMDKKAEADAEMNELYNVDTNVFKKYYGEEACKQFCADRKAFFDGLDEHNKEVVMRMAQKLIS